MAGDSDSRFSRRRYLTGASTVAAALLAGCPGNGGESTATDDEPDRIEDATDTETATATATAAVTDTETATVTGPGDGELRVAHWWRAGDGQDAITALVSGFRDRYPEAEIDMDRIRDGAPRSLRDGIRDRIESGTPPSTWQTWPGATLRPIAEDGLLRDIEASVWDRNDMKTAYTEGVQQLAAPAGDLVTVPLSVHRVNNLFYNVDVVESAGVDPEGISSPRALIDAFEAVATETDAVPMAHQTRAPWSTVQLWETVLLGEHGAETYETVTSGQVGQVEREIEDTLAITAEYSDYFNEDAAAVSFTEANRRVIEGEAAFIHQGDWAAGAYRDTGDFEFETDWNRTPFPGTDGLYAVTVDSFPYPTNNPSPDTTTTFLRYCGSAEGQVRFNAEKGSIPPRTDVPADRFGPFLTGQMRDYEQSTAQPPSIMHGLAVRPPVRDELGTAFGTFTSDWDVERTAEAIRTAF